MQLTTHIKRLIYPLYIYPKITSKSRNKLHKLFNSYAEQHEKAITASIINLRLFSNMEEDGIILWLLAAIRTKEGYFIDIGSNDCVNSNCANLAFNFNWGGLFIDGNEKLLKTGKRNYTLFGKSQNLNFVHSRLYPGNVNDIVSAHVATNDIDFMSIDIDGNDYAIWKALECVTPKLVVIENKIEYGRHDLVVPVDDQYLPSQWGASISSLTKLAEEKGYTLVAVNEAGFNAFYMRNDHFMLSGLQPLLLEKVFNLYSIKKSFYPNNIMQPLLQQVGEGLNSPEQSPLNTQPPSVSEIYIK